MKKFTQVKTIRNIKKVKTIKKEFKPDKEFKPNKVIVKPIKKSKLVPKTIEFNELIVSIILTFCENAAELGCPQHKDVDMWFRELEPENMIKVANKLLEIAERE